MAKAPIKKQATKKTTAKTVGAKAAPKKAKALKRRKDKDGSTEDKIREAARKLFVRKGYAAVKTRDIAEEAEINLALLNYYFRSKEKLFELIMRESMNQFIHGIAVVLADPKTSMDEKIELLVSRYIDMMLEFPDLPMFILSEVRNAPEAFAGKINAEVDPFRTRFFEQVRAGMKAGKMKEIHPVHFMANLMGLIIFPFLGAPILKRIGGVNDEEFNALMLERKKLVPAMVKAMLKGA